MVGLADGTLRFHPGLRRWVFPSLLTVEMQCGYQSGAPIVQPAACTARASSV